MPTPTTDDRHIVIDCETCHRTIWSGTKCLHGQIPSPSPVAEAYPPIEDEKVRVLPTRKGPKGFRNP